MHPDERRRSLLRAVKEVIGAIEVYAGKRIDGGFQIAVICISEINAGRATVEDLHHVTRLILAEAEQRLLGEVL